MQLDIKKAIQSPFSDETWFFKMIFPTIMVALGAIGDKHLHIPYLYVNIVFLVTIIPNLILEGFFLQFQHNEIKNEKPILPILKSNVFRYLKYGFKSLSFMGYYTALFLLTCILIYIFTKMTLIKSNGLVAIVLICVSFFFFLIMYLMAQSTYAENFKLRDTFDFNRLLKLIVKAKSDILIFIVYSVAIILLYLFVFYWLAATIVGLLLIPFLSTAVGFALFNLQAQFYKIAKFRLENTETELAEQVS